METPGHVLKVLEFKFTFILKSCNESAAVDLMHCRNIRLSLLCFPRSLLLLWYRKKMSVLLLLIPHVIMSPHRDAPLSQGYSAHSDPVALYHHCRPPRLILSFANHCYFQRVLALGHPSRPEVLSPANREFPEGPRETLIRYTATRARPSSGKCHIFVQSDIQACGPRCLSPSSVTLSC